MTRIAVLTDIHANIPALDAVLRDLDEQKVDEVLIGGDLVGRGPQGSAVITKIRERGWPSVRGNHEDYMLNFRHKRVPPDWLEVDFWCASRWMSAELSEEDITYIESLPNSITSTLEPSLHLVHGSTESNQEGLGSWTDDAILQKHLDAIPGDLLVCGHTHRTLLHRASCGGLVVNVGSVGLPFNGDSRAQYAIFTRLKNDPYWDVDFRQIAYAKQDLMDAYTQTGFLEAGSFTSILLLREIEHARPFLVPFLRWAQALGFVPNIDDIPRFLSIYDPERSMHEQLKELEKHTKNKP